MRRTSKAATKARGTRRYKAGRKTFARAVKAVINKVAERKRWNKIIDQTLGLPNNTFTTWNLLDGIVQGTNTANRIGDKIHLNRLRLSMEVHNTSASGTALGACRFRAVIFRGKYDYSVSSYPLNEVFENNAGGAPSYPISAPVDLNQVTLLMDKVVTLTANFSGQKCSKHMQVYLPINKVFNFREDDTYGKVSNLYLGIYQTNFDAISLNIAGNCQVSFTDV